MEKTCTVGPMAAVTEIKHRPLRLTESVEWETRKWPEGTAERITLVEVVDGLTDSDRKRYNVFLDRIVYVGSVYSYRVEVWRKSGRIRTSLVGKPKVWTARSNTGREVGHQHHARVAAVVALVNDHLGIDPYQ